MKITYLGLSKQPSCEKVLKACCTLIESIAALLCFHSSEVRIGATATVYAIFKSD